MLKIPSVSLNSHDIRFDPDDSRAVYIGLNSLNGATTSAADWQIFEFTYTTTTSSNITRIRITSGIYDDRATLFP